MTAADHFITSLIAMLATDRTDDSEPEASLGLTFVGWSGLALLALLFLQQWCIFRVKERHWPHAAIVYRRHFLFAVCVVTGYVAVFLSAFALWSPEAPGAYRSIFEGRATIPSIVLLATAIAIIRLLLERTIDEPKTIGRLVWNIFESFRYIFEEPPETKSRIREWSTGLSLTPIWLLSFASIIAVEVALKLVSGQFSGKWSGAGYSVLFNLVAAGCYFFWIYVSIYDKLVREHHFSGSAARMFIGSVFRTFVPFQAVVVGPQRAGKTAFCRGNAIPDADRTMLLEQISVTKDGRTAGKRFRALLTLLDTPGECLGDHVTAIAFYRTDFLVLIVRYSHLKQAALGEMQLSPDLSNLEDFFTDQSKDYLYVLRQALRRGAVQEGENIPDIYRVHRFCMFVNLDSGGEIEAAAIMGNLKVIQMARLIGERFGVAAGPRSVLLCAAATNGGAARDRLSDLQYLDQVASDQSAALGQDNPL